MFDKSKAFTLLELIVTIAVVGILSSIALPSFNGVMKDSRLTANVNLVVGAFNIARSEAINRGVPVKVQNITNGWAVVIVSNNEELNRFEPDSKGIIWTPTVFPDVVYNPTGFRPFNLPVLTIKLEDDRGIFKVVTISQSGSTSVD
jgi:prepilin-type N-terminal cleavage/methylation domain-containing protein